MRKKLANIIYSPLTLILLWLMLLFSPLLGSVKYYYITHPSSLGEIGFLLKIIEKGSIPVLFLATLTLLLFWFRSFFQTRTLSRKQAIGLGFILISSVLYELLINYLQELNALKYSNYLYSKYGLNPGTLEIASVVVIIIFCIATSLVISSFQPIFRPFPKRVPKHTFDIPTLICSASFLILLSQAFFPFQSIPRLKKEVNQGYEQRLGREYVYVKAIEDLTPRNSTVIHPPQGNQWPLIGNQPVIRFFLFPRQLVSGALIESQSFVVIFQDVYFVEIPSSLTSPAWPIINRDEKGITFDETNEIRYRDLNLVGTLNGVSVYRVLFK